VPQVTRLKVIGVVGDRSLTGTAGVGLQHRAGVAADDVTAAVVHLAMRCNI
jgi:hypothetical protein